MILKLNQKQLAFNLGLIIVFALAWVLPRYQLFTENVMMHDDYVLSNSVGAVIGQSLIAHRPSSMYLILGTLYLIPNLFSSNVSMIISALSMGAVSLLLWKLLQFIFKEKNKSLNFFMILLFLFHPVINDFSAWNTVVHQVWALLTALLAFYFIWNRGVFYFIVGTVLMFITVSSYQLMLSIPLAIGFLLFFHLGTLNEKWHFSKMIRLIAGLAIASILYVVYMKYISHYLLKFYTIPVDQVTHIDLVFPNLKESFFRTLDVYLNLYFPLLTHYVGANIGLSYWKFVPLTVLCIGGISILVLIYKKRIKFIPSILIFFVWLILPFVAMMPFWIISIYTEWRVSVIMFIPQIFVFSSILLTFSIAIQSLNHDCISRIYKASVIFVFILIYGVLLPVNAFDIKMRVEDYLYDRSIADNIKAYWQSEGIDISDYRVVYKKSDSKTVVERGNLLTKANVFINTYSTLSYGKIWGNAFMRFHDFTILDYETVQHLEADPSIRKEINFKRNERLIPLPFVVHYPDDKISIIYGMPQVVARY